MILEVLPVFPYIWHLTSRSWLPGDNGRVVTEGGGGYVRGRTSKNCMRHYFHLMLQSYWTRKRPKCLTKSILMFSEMNGNHPGWLLSGWVCAEKQNLKTSGIDWKIHTQQFMLINNGWNRIQVVIFIEVNSVYMLYQRNYHDLVMEF